MRIALDVGEGVVLAVHGDPLARPDPGGHPDDEPEDLVRRRAQRQRPVGERPVEVDGGRDVGEERDHDADDDGEPGRSAASGSG